MYKWIDRVNFIGNLDVNSVDGIGNPADFRILQNVQREGDNILRREGWSELFSDSKGHLILGLKSLRKQFGEKQTFTMIKQRLLPEEGINQLMVGTQDKIYVYESQLKSWILVGDMNTDGITDNFPRIQCAVLDDTVIFNNQKSSPLAMTGNSRVATTITDLVKLNIDRARIIRTFQNILVLANVRQDDTEKPSRILWSNLEDATSFNPSIDGSISGYIDILDDPTEIIGMEVLGSYLFVFKRNSIWRGQLNTETVLQFDKVYTSPANGCDLPGFTHTIVNTGEDLYYLAPNGIFMFNASQLAPKEILINTKPIILNDLNQNNFIQAIGHFNSSTDEVWFSWSTKGSTSINKTLCINTINGFVSTIDDGFTALGEYTPTTFDLGDTGTSKTPDGVNKTNVVQTVVAANSSDFLCRYGCGIFSRCGKDYDSILETLPTNFGTSANYKRFKEIKVEGLAGNDGITRPSYYYKKPHQILVQVGHSERPGVAVSWDEAGIFKASEGNPVDQLYCYPFYVDKWFAYRFTLSGKDNPFTFISMSVLVGIGPKM